jgi:hypothetical protein
VPYAVRFVETMKGLTWLYEDSAPPPPPPWWRLDASNFDDAITTAVESRKDDSWTRPLQLADLAVTVSPHPGDDDGLHGNVVGGIVQWGPAPYSITGGEFVALATTLRGERRMRYRIFGQDGRHQIVIAGVKRVQGSARTIWSDTTTLQCVVYQPEASGILAAGIIRIRLRDFGRQLTSFRGRPGPILSFSANFVRRLT